MGIRDSKGGTNGRGHGVALRKYVDAWGPDWVTLRSRGETNEVRLRPLDEYRGRVEEPGRFLLIAGEEITDRHLNAPLHMNAHNLRFPIQAQGGLNVVPSLIPTPPRPTKERCS